MDLAIASARRVPLASMCQWRSTQAFAKTPSTACSTVSCSVSANSRVRLFGPWGIQKAMSRSCSELMSAEIAGAEADPIRSCIDPPPGDETECPGPESEPDGSVQFR